MRRLYVLGEEGKKGVGSGVCELVIGRLGGRLDRGLTILTGGLVFDQKGVYWVPKND